MQDQTFTYETRIQAAAERGFDWHTRPGAFERLSPPWSPVRLLDPGGGVAEGSRVQIRVPLIGPLYARWVAEHTEVVPGERFTDVQVRGPFAKWEHTHRFIADGPGAFIMRDRVVYRPPRLTLGLADRTIRRDLERLFAYRHRTLRDDLAMHTSAPIRVLVTGSTGLVGTALCAALSTGGHEVVRLSRGGADPNTPQRVIRWEPMKGRLDAAELEGFDAVVHLAGYNVASGRWNARRRRLIRDSRVLSTDLLARALAGCDSPPRVLVCASATGFYGDRGEETLTEDSPRGKGFLAEIAFEWEAAAEPARRAGIRTAHARLGMVLSAAGGALAPMATLFGLGLGGRIGSGRQRWPWIALDDVVGAIHHLVVTDSVQGPVNFAAPQSVTNRELTRTLGRVLRRPTVLPVPGVVVKAALGQLGRELALAGACVEPRALVESGYTFRTPTLEAALRHTLGREGAADG